MSEVLYSYIKGKGWVVESGFGRYSPEDVNWHKTLDGRVLRLTEMDDKHLVNTRALLQRKLDSREYGLCCPFGDCRKCSFSALDLLRRRIAAFDAELGRRRYTVLR